MVSLVVSILTGLKYLNIAGVKSQACPTLHLVVGDNLTPFVYLSNLVGGGK